MKKSEEIPQKKTVYLVFQPGDAGESGYWNQYESVADAVTDQGDGSEVWIAKPKRLGKFRMRTRAERIKSRKAIHRASK